MNDLEANDGPVDDVLSRIDPQVLASMTSEQWEGVRAAVSAGLPQRRHAVAIRGRTLFGLHFCLLGGRDKRRSVRRAEFERRERTRRAASAAFLLVGFLCFVSLVVAFLYLIKSALGINVLPELHLRDVVGP